MENPDAQKVIAHYKFWGQPVPNGLEAPELHDVEVIFWRAFWRLHTDRRGAMGTTPIPWSSIKKYARDLKAVPFDVLERIIREMDDVYLSQKAKQAENPPQGKR